MEIRECKKHGPAKHFWRKDQKAWRCSKCSATHVANRRRKVKEILVREHGGRCQRCGYNKCVAALDFHHRDSSEKKFSISSGNTPAIEKLRKEAQKCILICKNCHAELHSLAGAP